MACLTQTADFTEVMSGECVSSIAYKSSHGDSAIICKWSDIFVINFVLDTDLLLYARVYALNSTEFIRNFIDYVGPVHQWLNIVHSPLGFERNGGAINSRNCRSSPRWQFNMYPKCILTPFAYALICRITADRNC